MSNRYNLYDGHGEPADSADPYVAVFNHWESSVVQLRAIENRVADSYKDLIRKYQEKVAECEREKRNAMLWEKEQRMAERELNGLKAAAVSFFLLSSFRRWGGPRTPHCHVQANMTLRNHPLLHSLSLTATAPFFGRT